ncbi:MAG: hypothetical protein JNJ58_13400 [Chitinophagaceae bacterium]|nr:hypothetical protein [Chitinophagaceae bacterium]
MIQKKSVIGLTAAITLLLFGLVACVEKTPKSITGYAPVYGDTATTLLIQSEPARPIVHGGKIYQYQNYTFQIENGEGIHIINSSNPANPQKIGFIRVGGCSEISIRNNILYTDNHQDLVAINISNINQVSVASRVERVFPGINQSYPPYNGVWFECVDPSKGIVIGWTEKLLVNPKCKR